MKVWQRLTAGLSAGLLILFSQTEAARAQDTQAISILSDIMVPILVIIDHLLDYWVNAVTGNSLTEPWGTQLVASLSTIIQSMTQFFAQFSLLLPSNSL